MGLLMRVEVLVVMLAASFLWSPIAAARGPSFDCRRASFPDEFVICRTPGLAQLDNQIAAAYAHLRNARGRSFADEVKIPTLRRRQACRSDALCIKDRQLEALNAYRAAGAPVAYAPVPYEATKGPSKEPITGPAPPHNAESRQAQSTGPNSPGANHEPQEVQPHQVTSGLGSFINSEGDVLTTAQVVKDCSEIRVAGLGQENYEVGRLIARDAANDLALVKAVAKPSRVGTLRFGIRLGENVEEFERPANQSPSEGGNLTAGTVTDLAGIAGDNRYLQISAGIQPGGSGEPLLDDNGYIVGIVSSEPGSLAALRAAGDVPQNVSFGIKATVAATFLRDSKVKFQVSDALRPMDAPAIADEAKALSVSIECR
jgi:S1-C subfamily serine protease